MLARLVVLIFFFFVSISLYIIWKFQELQRSEGISIDIYYIRNYSWELLGYIDLLTYLLTYRGRRRGRGGRGDGPYMFNINNILKGKSIFRKTLMRRTAWFNIFTEKFSGLINKREVGSHIWFCISLLWYNTLCNLWTTALYTQKRMEVERSSNHTRLLLYHHYSDLISLFQFQPLAVALW